MSFYELVESKGFAWICFVWAIWFAISTPFGGYEFYGNEFYAPGSIALFGAWRWPIFLFGIGMRVAMIYFCLRQWFAYRKRTRYEEADR